MDQSYISIFNNYNYVPKFVLGNESVTYAAEIVIRFLVIHEILYFRTIINIVSSKILRSKDITLPINAT